MTKLIPSQQNEQIAKHKLDLLKQKIALQRGLPHLYGFKHYKWSLDFFETQNRIAVLCSANQIGKSTVQIRKMVHWATCPQLWPQLWTSEPKQFWYLYPNKDTAQIEYESKWIPEILPGRKYKNHPQYGWQPVIFNKRIWAIRFNTGVTIYFKSYGQDIHDLQSGTVYYLALDEEPNEEIMPELFKRLTAVDGFMSAVFTPTKGQQYWRDIVEVRGEGERFPKAFKRQVSMFDCLLYADGTPSHWTLQKIDHAIATCGTPQEVEKRVFGRFVLAGGLKYPGFYRHRNVIPGHPLPQGWGFYSGADIGSGGKNHPGAITVLGVRPDFRAGRIFRHWRGDGVETTAGDILDRQMAMTIDLPNCRNFYDTACRDYYLLACSKGFPVEPAEKSHSFGEHILNVLFKNNMLMGYDYPECRPLWNELSTLTVDTIKRNAKDDSCDSLRYAACGVPWDFTELQAPEVKSITKNVNNRKLKDDRKDYWDGAGVYEGKGLVTIEQELAEWNNLMGVGDEF